jgi:hypothetical protein
VPIRPVAAVALAVAATIAFTWPQALVIGSATPEHIDATFNIWRVSWIAHQLRAAPADLFDANIFHPLRRTLALSDPILVPAVLGAPFVWAGLHPIAVTNSLVLLAFVTNALGAGWLAWQITGRAMPAALAGLIYAFAPFRFDHYMHLELLWAWWMPLAMVALHRLLAAGSVRAGLAFGLLFALQVLSCIYYGVFFATALGVLIPLLVWRARAARMPAVARGLAVGAAAAAVLIVPYARPLVRNQSAVAPRTVERAAAHSGTLVSYGSATHGNWLYGWTSKFSRGEQRFFPGVVPVLVAAGSLLPPISPTVVAYGAATALAFDASLGFNGITYPVLQRTLHPYRGLRVPARFNAIFLLGLSVLAAIGLVRWLQCLRSTGLRTAAGVAALALTALEYGAAPLDLAPLERTPPPAQSWLVGQPRGPVAIVPMPDVNWWPLHDSRYQYWSIFHWQPLVNGYSGFYPLQYRNVTLAMESFPDDAAVEALRSRDTRYVIVHGRFLERSRYERMVGRFEARDDVTLRAVVPDGDAEARVYELSGQGPGG